MRSGIGNSASDPLFVSDVGAGTGTSAQQTQGNVAAGAADSGNPVKVGGVFNTTAPTLTNGQRGDLQLGSRGAAAVTLFGKDSANFAAMSGPTNGQNSQIGLYTVAQNTVHNGVQWDLARKPNAFKRVASSAAAGNPDFLKASAGEVMQFWGECGATKAYLQLYNKASAPVIGTDVPVLTFPIAASANFSQSIPNGGAYFPTGIAFAFTTDAAGATGSAAAAITAFSLLGA